jgi:putative ABC transport system permease protein
MMEVFAYIWRDIRYALQWLRRNPSFGVAAILTMAVGIGANTCVFSIVESNLFFSLSYPQPDRIVSAGSHEEFAFESWEENNKTCEAISGQTNDEAILVGAGAAERLTVAKVTSGFFNVLGVKLALGRPFLPSETRVGGPSAAAQIAILSFNLWRDRFGANPRVVGEAIHLDDKLYSVVGVMSKDFEFPTPRSREPDLFLPLNLAGTLVTGPNGQIISASGRMVSVLGRLKSGITMPEAQAELRAISRERIAGIGSVVSVVSLRDYLVGKTGPTFLIFWGAVGFVLLIASVNLSNLMLGRAVSRDREIAVRVALGARRGRVAQQLFTEAVLIAAFGALAGVAIAYALVVLVRTFGPGNIPRLSQAHINLPVLGFTALVTGLAGILAGLAPVRLAWRVPTIETLKEGPRASVGRGYHRLRSALAVAEIAIALVLTVGAGLLVRSFLRLTGVPLHFDPHNLLTAQLVLPQAKYANAAQIEESLLVGIERFPAVRAVAAGERGPMMGLSGGGSMYLEGDSGNGQATTVFAGINAVSRGFFHAVGTPVLEGREFQQTDTATSQPVAIVNQEFARRFVPRGAVLGQKIDHVSGVKDWKGEATIIGVVADEEENELSPVVYLDFAQHPTPYLTVLIRTRQNPNTIVPALREQVAELDSDVPIFDVMAMEQLLGEQVARPRFETLVLSVFALIALLLAALGVYGAISYSVGQRTHEIGVRMAFGAGKSAVMRMVLGETLVMALAGIAIGMAGAFALTRYLQSLLYQIRPDDPSSFALAAGVLLAAALLAGFIPARRATEVDPIAALRYE